MTASFTSRRTLALALRLLLATSTATTTAFGAQASAASDVRDPGPPPQGLGLVYLSPVSVKTPDAGDLPVVVEDALVASATTRLSGTGWTLLTRATLQRLLADRGVDGLAAHAASQSELEFARLARVRYLVTTTVRPFEGTLVATQILIDCTTGEPVASARSESSDPRALVTRLERDVDTLLANLPNADDPPPPVSTTRRDLPLAVGPAPAPDLAPLEPADDGRSERHRRVLVRLAGDLEDSDSFFDELRRRLEERGFTVLESGKDAPWMVRITLRHSSPEGVRGSRLRPAFVHASYVLERNIGRAGSPGRAAETIARGRIEGRAVHVDASVGRHRALEDGARKLAGQLALQLVDAGPRTGR